MLATLLLWFVLSLLTGYMGRHRAFGFWGFFFASLLFTPFLVLLILILTTPVKG